jgi:hypothetical protein
MGKRKEKSIETALNFKTLPFLFKELGQVQ